MDPAFETEITRCKKQDGRSSELFFVDGDLVDHPGYVWVKEPKINSKKLMTVMFYNNDHNTTAAFKTFGFF